MKTKRQLQFLEELKAKRKVNHRNGMENLVVVQGKITKIKLTKNKWALIDTEDLYKIKEFKWCSSHAYALTGVYWKKIYMHRIIINPFMDEQVDHINGDGLDNRKENLRVCTNTQNQYNSKKRKNTSSKYKGVSFYKLSKKWNAKLQYNKKSLNLGYFNSEIEAAKAYNNASLKYHREFANINKLKS